MGTDRQQQTTPDPTYIYGDELDPYADYDDSCLILGLNLNSLIKDNYKEKNDSLRDFVRKYNWDIMAYQEPNLNHDLVSMKDQWDERVLGW